MAAMKKKEILVAIGTGLRARGLALLRRLALLAKFELATGLIAAVWLLVEHLFSGRFGHPISTAFALMMFVLCIAGTPFILLFSLPSPGIDPAGRTWRKSLVEALLAALALGFFGLILSDILFVGEALRGRHYDVKDCASVNELRREIESDSFDLETIIPSDATHIDFEGSSGFLPYYNYACTLSEEHLTAYANSRDYALTTNILCNANPDVKINGAPEVISPETWFLPAPAPTNYLGYCYRHGNGGGITLVYDRDTNRLSVFFSSN